MSSRGLLFVWCFLLVFFHYGLSAQSRKGDLENIARHRRVYSGPPVISSLDGFTGSVSDSLLSRIGSWVLTEDVDVEEHSSGSSDIVLPDSSVSLAFVEGTDPEVMLSVCPDFVSSVSSFIALNSEGLSRALGRFAFYRERFLDVFVSYGIPEDIALLSVVESALKIDAVSHAGAAGIWQLMPYTAGDYGLECSLRIDERMDIDRSTVAAARYLRDAYRRLGSWQLAVTAYNCGCECVERAVVMAGGSSDFWDIRQFLPAETRAYTPAFNAVVMAWHFSDIYGIDVLPYDPGVVEFRIDWDMPFRQLEAATGISFEEFISCNPQYLSGYVPGAERVRFLRLPRRYARLYRDNIRVVDF